MKFYCDACNTKYAISDDKVQGKVLKVRCKNCGNIITVREAVAPISAQPRLQTDPAISAPSHIPTAEPLTVPTTNWYYALNGQTFGPFTLDGLRRKYATAEIGDATYVWHERLGAWKPVSNEPAFADALAIGHRIVPSRKTLGFTGPVEAIRVTHGGPSKERAGAVPNASYQRAPERERTPSTPGTPQVATPESARQTAPREPQRPVVDPQRAAAEPEAKPEKPTTLPRPAGARATLTPPAKPQVAVAQGPEPPSAASRPEVAPKPARTPEARPIKDVRKDNLSRLRAKLGSSFAAEDEVDESPADDARAGELLPRPVGGEAIFTYASGVGPASTDSLDEIDARDDVVDFNLPPRARPAKPSPSSTSDILERVIGPSEPPTDASEASEVEDSGMIPFLPEAPRLPSQIKGISGQEATSESLMLDVDRMNTSRKRGVALAVIGVAVCVVLVAVAIGTIGGDDETEAVAGATGPPPAVDHKDDLVIPRYNKDEIGKLATLDLEEELLFDEDEVEESGDGMPAEEQVAADTAQEQRAVASSTKTPDKSPPADTKPPAVKLKKDKQKEVVPEEPPQSVDPLAALLAPRADRATIIKAPEDKLRTQRSEGLSKDQARRGFQKIRQSIRDCRERHNRHNAALGVGKLKISVTVDSSGSVSEFSLNPRSVQNTEFHACMTSHRARWRFASFDGQPVVINTSVIIQ